MNEEEAKAADKKSIKRTVVFICICCIIAIIVIGFAYIHVRDEQDRQKQWEADYLRALAYSTDAWIRSQNAHDNYTQDAVAFSLYKNITATYPFLVAQVKTLTADIDVLTNNITVPNYYTAFKQYLLCKIINKAYEQNSSVYFTFIKKFTWMDYNCYDDVVYIADEPRCGYWVKDYQPTLDDAKSKLDFISGVLDIIYTR